MTQEDKELLLKDLCARLPYGVIVKYKSQEGEGDVQLGCGNIGYVLQLGNGWWKECKPYLRPLSSMTEEEKADLEEYSKQELDKYADAVLDCADKDTVRYAQVALMYKDIDWYTKKHFDYRGLIPMGLALEAPEDMYSI